MYGREKEKMQEDSTEILRNIAVCLKFLLVVMITMMIKIKDALQIKIKSFSFVHLELNSVFLKMNIIANYFFLKWVRWSSQL